MEYKLSHKDVIIYLILTLIMLTHYRRLSLIVVVFQLMNLKHQLAKHVLGDHPCREKTDQGHFIKV
jgi:hypothetical protein